MKLRYSPTSPYVRKVLVCAFELGLDAQITRIPTDPWSEDGLRSDNPLGKVPVLILEDGTQLYDSPVICEYLNVLAGGSLIPATGAGRWTELRRQALADGIMDAAVLWRLEQLRPADKQYAPTMARQAAAITAALLQLEIEVTDSVTIGGIAAACALGYLDFRHGGFDWRGSHPRLAAWYGPFAERPALEKTKP